jgi:hypothetical protein
MKNIKRKLLSAGLAVATAVIPVVGATSCKQPTDSEKPVIKPGPETAQSFPIEGTDIVIYGLPSLVNPYYDNFVAAINLIYDSGTSGSMVDTFRNYVIQAGQLIITVEDVEAYADDKKFRPISESEFAMRSAFLSTKPDLFTPLLSVVNGMNNIYHLVSLGKQFNNAKETIRLSRGKFLVPQRQA